MSNRADRVTINQLGNPKDAAKVAFLQCYALTRMYQRQMETLLPIICEGDSINKKSLSMIEDVRRKTFLKHPQDIEGSPTIDDFLAMGDAFAVVNYWFINEQSLDTNFDPTKRVVRISFKKTVFYYYIWY
jgi:hypothetical protein